jgi:hypothetical protein
MSRDRDIDEAFDVRIEPWDPKLPGCKGDCQQGRRPCLSPEECSPDQPLTRNGCFIILGAAALAWALVAIAFLAALALHNWWAGL